MRISGHIRSEYVYGATRVCWGVERLSLYQRWSPVHVEIPFVVLTSHHILYNEHVKESHHYNCDEFVASLEHSRHLSQYIVIYVMYIAY